ncbi:hypothetical protein [Fictibacillus barbaricus]|uniref:Uncharacterized protein n=1 Tax=Fictibacillus barbaricus TaxID=182136 RepID=A0ABS2ZIC8_9BACL|nr:hypothetical protein [Fictibacillus barbaricus]MBN3547531.1 hypothetical protein [Fictibacillus barbaricus]GGB49655.1 hypothetical protein GCM10007199_14160 [Fictibacillus barbaricus]
MIFLQPEFCNSQGEIINIVDTNGKAVGYIAYMYKGENDLYIMGQLDNEGEKQNFIDVTSRFIDGLKKSILGNGEKEPNLFLHLGGEAIGMDNGEEENS